jgi:hypothetical protein
MERRRATGHDMDIWLMRLELLDLSLNLAVNPGIHTLSMVSYWCIKKSPVAYVL